MEIQQHDGVVVEVADLGRASPSFYERERCSREEGGAQGRVSAALPPPPLYRTPWEGGRRPNPSRVGGGGQGGCLPPQGT